MVMVAARSECVSACVSVCWWGGGGGCDVIFNITVGAYN